MFLPFNGAGDPFVVPQDERAFPTELAAMLKQIIARQGDELNIGFEGHRDLRKTCSVSALACLRGWTP